ncbi:hypothetical protein FFLO_01839 [Filobasidium floriforme]|uniref:Cora-domain-containing protein n=1 Tax=Filobasidium floriforme TaxID=5210 RepID=A0A8K0JNP7_9TREE|nr:hypothetical protein FFLO_01839 [Filobasidium floriforme]
MSPSATSPRFIIHNPPLPSRSSTNPENVLSELGNSPSRPFNINTPGGSSITSNPRDIPHLDVPPAGGGRSGARSYSRGEKGMREREADREADRERQRLQDIDSAKSMSRARSNSIASPEDAIPPLMKRALHSHSRYPKTSPIDESPFPALSEREEAEMEHARRGSYTENVDDEDQDGYPVQARERERERDREREREEEEEEEEMRMAMERRLSHERHLESDSIMHEMGLGDRRGGGNGRSSPVRTMASHLMGGMGTARNHFDFSSMDEFADKEKRVLRESSGGYHGTFGSNGMPEEARRAGVPEADLIGSASGSVQSNGRMIGGTTVGDAESVRISSPPTQQQDLPSRENENGEDDVGAGTFVRRRQRKSSQSQAVSNGARRQGRLALFEGLGGAFMGDGSARDGAGGQEYAKPSGYVDYPDGGRGNGGGERPYRFSFYSNALPATIHARSLSELPSEGQTFEDLFTGREPSNGNATDQRNSGSSDAGGFKSGSSSPQISNLGELHGSAPNPKLSLLAKATAKAGTGGSPPMKGQADMDDPEARTWWLDVLSPTDEEMRMLAKVFGIHPLTTEDILLEETREKIELFRNYYLVCFRSFDQDPYSQTYLEPLNMYIIVFREGTLSFHFRGTPHPQNVRRRIKSLKDYISVTSDWISYALIDDITDAFGPLIQSIEYEVDGIDELVLILKEAEQSDMLRRIGTCRKKVMGLLRLMGNKADVVKGLAKRCNENWSVAPKSDIGLYLSDIQDHLITMTQNLNHYEKILSRSHSNYLAQISIEMTDANNQINDVLSKLTALGTVLIPMNLVTGLWGMNVHVPGQDIESGYAWFGGILGALALFAVVGAWITVSLGSSPFLFAAHAS